MKSSNKILLGENFEMLLNHMTLIRDLMKEHYLMCPIKHIITLRC